jgi:hypothetical protein
MTTDDGKGFGWTITDGVVVAKGGENNLEIG